MAHRVIRIERDGKFTVVAGSGVPGYSGDGGPATEAALHHPTGITFDKDDNLYIADFDNNRIRKVDPQGVITTLAGTGDTGLSGDGWRATSVEVWQPQSVAVDMAGNVYIAELATHRIRRVNRNGFITTVAGSGVPGFDGDGAPRRRRDSTPRPTSRSIAPETSTSPIPGTGGSARSVPERKSLWKRNHRWSDSFPDGESLCAAARSSRRSVSARS